MKNTLENVTWKYRTHRATEKKGEDVLVANVPCTTDIVTIIGSLFFFLL